MTDDENRAYSNKLFKITAKKISKLFNVKTDDVIIYAIGQQNNIIQEIEFSIKNTIYKLYKI